MSLFTPLRDKNFCKLYIGRSISLLGTGIGRIALAFFAYHLAPQHAGLVVGIALVINMLTYIIMGPIYGHYAARIPRKEFLVTMDLVRVALLIMVPFLTAVWQVYVFVLLINICSAGFTPLYQAVIPEMLKDEQAYSQGLILSRITYNIETLLSPALAALLLLTFNFHALFFLNAVTYFISAFLILTVSFPAIVKSATLVKTHVLSGIQTYLCQPMLVACLVLVMLSTLAGATVIVNTVVFLHGLFGQSNSVTASAMFFFGIGAVSFALLMPTLRTRYDEYQLMQAGAVVLMLTFLAASMLHSWWYFYLAWFFLGIGTIAIEGLLGVVVNRFAQSHNRTAMFAANFSLTHACWLIGYAITALLGVPKLISVYFLSLFFISVILFLASRILYKKTNLVN